MLNMLSADAKVIQTSDGLIPADLVGLDRFEARRAVVERLEAEGLLERVEDRVIRPPMATARRRHRAVADRPMVCRRPHPRPAGDRGGALGKIKIVPKAWEKTWFNWLENIQPWCVSRQLWWGHQIPAWYDDQGNAFVAESEAEAQAQAGEGVTLRRDQDVLDTWFSSALWPFGTLGWPEDADFHPSPSGEGPGVGDVASAASDDRRHPNPSPQGEGLWKARSGSALARHYPNDVLISGFDIIFFWDARMAMQGIHFMGEAPWKTLYLHGLVRDSKGAKMSKSKGNTVDPLGLIDRYGADALRFTLAAMESQGRDIKLDEKRIEGYRNFATKLWNAARFCQANGIGASAQLEPPPAQLPVNRWILGKTVKTVQALDLALAELRFDECANTIYHFVWGSFCDWYLELIKGAVDDETKAVAGWVLDQILVMLHPFMPFITEELWNAMGSGPTR
jgi:valyl-tRNA synthetase